MIVDDVANTIRTAIELKLKATPVHTEYDSVKADGVDIVNEMWECPGMRKLHLETGQTEPVSYTHLTLPTIYSV